MKTGEDHLYMLLYKDFIINIKGLLTMRRSKMGIEYINQINDKAKLVYYNGRHLILKNAKFIYLFYKNDLNIKLLKKRIISNKL
jgi:hypothetical protein